MLGGIAALGLIAVGGVGYAIGQANDSRTPPGVSRVDLGSGQGDGPGQDGQRGERAGSPGQAWNGRDARRYVDPQSELDIEDQRGTGATVQVEQVKTSAPGFVVVYSADGTVLGSAPVTAESQPASITLDPALGAGMHRLTAALWVDDGDGIFDPSTDALIVDDRDDTRDHDPAESFDYEVS
jgi:hypothetical protein